MAERHDLKQVLVVTRQLLLRLGDMVREMDSD